MQSDLEKILFHEQTILSRLDQLAADITVEYREKELTVVAVLNGSLIFTADLLRRIPLPLKLDCISVASYRGGAQSTGRVVFNQLSMPDVNGRHVLIVDDILDSGRTLFAIREKLFAETRPLSMKICVLLRKTKQRAKPAEADFTGFDMADDFVVGYGLDYQERYRNLPFIGMLRAEKTGGDS